MARLRTHNKRAKRKHDKKVRPWPIIQMLPTPDLSLYHEYQRQAMEMLTKPYEPSFLYFPMNLGRPSAIEVLTNLGYRI